MSAAATGPASVADHAAEALRGTGNSADARKLLRPLTEERAVLAEDLRNAETAAMDPLISGAQAREAQALAERVRFDFARLDKLHAALVARVGDLEKAEAKADSDAEYKAAKAERDALAAEIAERYPAIVAELVSIMRRLAASNNRVSAANAGRRGEEWLYGAESIARGREDYSPTPGLLTSTKLPAPRDNAYLAWPRTSNEAAALEIDTHLATGKRRKAA